MANAQKLVNASITFEALQTNSAEAQYIYSTNASNPSSLGKAYNDPDNPFYHSIVFTSDAKIITHGKVYNTVAGTADISIISSISDTADIDLTLDNISDSSGKSLSAVLTSTGVTSGSYGSFASSNTQTSNIKIPQFTVDTKGRITEATQSANVRLDYVTSAQAAQNTSFKLLGHSAAGTTTTIFDDSVYVSLSNTSPAVATLFTPNISIPKPENILFGSATGSDPKTLKEYIDSVSTQAMSFKGTIASQSDLNNVSNTASDAGNTYKISDAGNYSFKLTGESTASSHALKVGDVLIANGNGTFSYIPAGDETETFITISDNVVSTKYSNASGNVSLGNAALQIVASSIANNAIGLATAQQVYNYVDNDTTHIKSFNLAAGLLSNNTTNTLVTNGNTVSLNLLNSTVQTGKEIGTGQVYGVLIDKNSKLAIETNTSLVFANSTTSTTNTTNGQYINLINNGTASNLFELAGSGISISSTANGKITFTNSGVTSIDGSTGAIQTSFANKHLKIGNKDYDLSSIDTNTWRPIKAYSLSRIVQTLDSEPETTGTKTLSFGAEFAYAEDDQTINSSSVSEIHLVWAEVTSSGITYHV